MATVFIYGPDSLQARVYDRLGPSEVVGGALLDGFALSFDKPNMKKTGEGLANLHPEAGAAAFGVVYELTRKQQELLEGFYGGYQRSTAWVRLVSGGGAPLEVSLLTARRRDAALKPSKRTLADTILGAEENGAPAAFIEGLRRIQSEGEAS